MTRVLVVGLATEISGWLAHDLPDTEVRAADDLDHALSALDSAWTLVVINHALAGGSGEELLRRARSGATRPVPPVIYCLDADTDWSIARRLVADLGVAQLLIHPLDRAQLARRARELAARPPAPSDRAVGLSVGALWSRYREGSVARVQALQDAVAALRAGALGREQRTMAENDAHKLAGSLGTFGLPSGSQLALEMERILAGDEMLGPPQIERLAELSLRLRAEVDRGPAD